jgi:hypothetical protein
MIVTWEEADVRVGRRIGKPGITERQIIGYIASPDPTSPVTYVVTSLDDGMTLVFESKAQLVTWLNNGGYQPEELL